MNNILDYLEFWATRHCNLSCRGCSVFSPVADEWYLDLDSINRDLARLKVFFSGINRIRILGGEPLLHPDIASVFDIVKRHYGGTDLCLVTNGFLLGNMDKAFWDSCIRNNVRLDITFFPIMPAGQREEILQRIESLSIRRHCTDKTIFKRIFVLKQTEKKEAVFKKCKFKIETNLYNGYLSHCTVAMAVPLANEIFGTRFDSSGRINIYAAKSAGEITNFLSVPSDTCLCCTSKQTRVPCEQTQSPSINDWLAG